MTISTQRPSTSKQKEKDEYPTLTICFDGYRGAIFDGSDDIFDQGNASAGTYQRYINGRPNYNKSSFDYNLNFFTGFFKSIQEMMCFFIIFKDYEEYIYKNWSSIKCSTN
mgnify:CR=1 FL=1